MGMSTDDGRGDSIGGLWRLARAPSQRDHRRGGIHGGRFHLGDTSLPLINNHCVIYRPSRTSNGRDRVESENLTHTVAQHYLCTLRNPNRESPHVDNTAGSLPTGRILIRALRHHPDQKYLLYLPSATLPETPVVVSVHGITRNAMRHANRLIQMCEERGALLVLPIFDNNLHPDYQRLGRQGRGIRSDLALNRCLEEVAVLTGANVSQNILIGFSGGAQLVHRYAMVHPHRVVRAVVVAAGWYTFPDPGERYPHGIRPARSLQGVIFDPEQFLRVPIDVLVGLDDVGSANLRRTDRVNAQQGTTRVERARNWVAGMRHAASAFGLETQLTLTEVEGVGHSFTSFCEQGRLIEQIDELTFGPKTPNHPMYRGGNVALGGRVYAPSPTSVELCSPGWPIPTKAA